MANKKSVAAKKPKSYAGMNIVEAKLRQLADAAISAANAYKRDPVRIACKKAGVKQAVSSSFFNDELDRLDEKLLAVDNIVHGWEVESIADLADQRQHPDSYKKFQKFLKLDR